MFVYFRFHHRLPVAATSHARWFLISTNSRHCSLVGGGWSGSAVVGLSSPRAARLLSSGVADLERQPPSATAHTRRLLPVPV